MLCPLVDVDCVGHFVVELASRNSSGTWHVGIGAPALLVKLTLAALGLDADEVGGSTPFLSSLTQVL